MAQQWAKTFYNSKAWQRCRDAYITSVCGLCQECAKKNIIASGYIVHHKTELNSQNISDPNITLNWDNLTYVCRECHNKIHMGSSEALADGLEFDEYGDLIAPH